MAIYLTGDCHLDFKKFENKEFEDQRRLSKNTKWNYGMLVRCKE